jgi:nicotinamide-nucleotide amidase
MALGEPRNLPQRWRIVCIGDELLSGLRRDTNSQELVERLVPLGIPIREIRLVPDDPDTIAALAAEPGWFTLGTGGLGPTVDDRSREVLARAFEARLEHDPAHRARFQARLAANGRDPESAHPGQSLHPVPGLNFPNPVGSADGLLFHQACDHQDPDRRRVWLALPGVPSEMRALMDEQVLPWLSRTVVAPDRPAPVYARVWRLPEQEVARRLAPLEDFRHCDEPGFYPGPEGVLVRFQPRPGSGDAGQRETRRLLEERLAGYILLRDARNLADWLLDHLGGRGERLAVAESCTGGLLAGALTRVPGSSAVFAGGMVTYSNALKEHWLEVPGDLLLEHGAVSGPCVEAMARRVREAADTQWSLAVSGIAGPGGGSPEKPLGTVWLGLSGPMGERSRLFRLGGNREQVRSRAVGMALAWLCRTLQETDPGAGD